MKMIPHFVLIAVLAFPLAVSAQMQESGRVDAVPAPEGAVIAAAPGQMPAPPDGPDIVTGKRIIVRRDMGKWWQDSKLAKQLQLADTQISKLNQIFYDHRLKLIDDDAAMEKADLGLQNLLDQDEPKDSDVEAQMDQVLAARGKLEREYTMMNLDLRKVLSVQQWRQLKSIREQRGPADHVFFYRKFSTGSGPMPPPPPPNPGGDDMF
jgi:Spy/CpxP family protein refolding chaperone